MNRDTPIYVKSARFTQEGIKTKTWIHDITNRVGNICPFGRLLQLKEPIYTYTSISMSITYTSTIYIFMYIHIYTYLKPKKPLADC